MKIKVFPAKSGDAFLVNCDGKNILIDGGFSETYDKFIKKSLIELNSKREKLDLMVITHIDSDHIGGILKLLTQNNTLSESKIVEIKEIWHNSYRHLQFNYSNQVEVEKEKRQNRVLKNIILSGHSTIRSKNGKISVKQGSMAASYILEGDYDWNMKFNNESVQINEYERILLSEALSVIILSPNKEGLNKLKEKWEKELRKKIVGFEFNNSQLFDDAFEYSMIRNSNEKIKNSKKCSLNKKFNIDKIELCEIDKSVINGSSIAFILEHKDKKALFLGDANPLVIEESLNKLKANGYEVVFDLVKVSHHGSMANTTSSLINLISAKKWLFSGNGNNGNPDMNLLKLILKLKRDKEKKIIFNYNLDWLKNFENMFLMKKYNYELLINKKEEIMEFEI